jgi:hypothetical protein
MGDHAQGQRERDAAIKHVERGLKIYRENDSTHPLLIEHKRNDLADLHKASRAHYNTHVPDVQKSDAHHLKRMENMGAFTRMGPRNMLRSYQARQRSRSPPPRATAGRR